MLYDVLLVALIIASVIIGYKKGAAKTILSAASIVIAAVLALFISRMLSAFIYDTFFKEALESKIASALEKSVLGTIADATESVVAAIPAIIVGAMSFFGMTQSSFEEYCGTAVNDGGVSAATGIAGKLSPVVTGLISIVLTVVLFVVFSFILKLVLRPVAKLFKLPLIRTPNSLAGGVLGFVKGVVTVVIVAVLLKLLMPIIPAQWTFFSQENIDKSHIFSFVYDGGLLSSIQKFIYRIG